MGARTVTVIGATGFVGRHLVPLLVDRGHRVVAVSRRGDRLDGWGDAVDTSAADVATGDGLGRAMGGAQAVVHLAAIPRESGGRTFEEVNVNGTRRVVNAATAAGVRRFVHLSVMGVTDDARLRYLSSKWRGERLVRDSALDWVVIRPSILFGEDDGFFNLIKTTLRWWSPGVVAIPGRGDTRFQPLSVDDLVMAIERATSGDEHSRVVYEVGGPDYVSYREIVDAVMRATHMRRIKLSLPIPLISVLTAVTDRVLPIFPVSHDQIRSLGRPNFTDRDAFARAFGFAPRPFDVSYLG